MVSFCLNSPTPFGINYSHFICNEWSHRMHSGYWGLKGHKILLLNLYLTWWKLRLHGLCKTFFLTTNRRKYLSRLNAEAFWYCLSKYRPLSFLEAISGETLLVAGKRNRETRSCQSTSVAVTWLTTSLKCKSRQDLFARKGSCQLRTCCRSYRSQLANFQWFQQRLFGSGQRSASCLHYVWSTCSSILHLLQFSIWAEIGNFILEAIYFQLIGICITSLCISLSPAYNTDSLDNFTSRRIKDFQRH